MTQNRWSRCPGVCTTCGVQAGSRRTSASDLALVAEGEALTACGCPGFPPITSTESTHSKSTTLPSSSGSRQIRPKTWEGCNDKRSPQTFHRCTRLLVNTAGGAVTHDDREC